jgi:2-keto-4-pentenoate hydratase/2-oxohepta-3-ene-1,7-dioic acid hydratase in catechol pathway
MEMQALKVCVYDAGAGDKVGSVIDDRVYDLNLCCLQQLASEKQFLDAYRLANTLVPPELEGFLRGGARVLAAAREALAFVLKAGSQEAPAGERLFYRTEAVKLKAPILPHTKVICMALAYKSHADVGGKIPYSFPNWFTKINQVVVGPDDWVVLPKHHPDPVVYGTELTAVIGKHGKCIPEDQAEDHIWGYTILNDVTLRGQKDRPDRPSRKEFDTSAPVGPWIVPKDQIADPHNLRLSFRINGKQVQDGSTSSLLWPIPTIVAEVSRWLTLNPGDIIATGDVGATEPLKPGDITEAEVESLGILRNPVRLEE